MYKLQSKRLATTSVSLHTQTGSPCLTIQVLNIGVYFMDLWYTWLTSVHINLEHELVIVTQSFTPLNLDYTTSFVKVWIRSDATSHAIPDVVYLPSHWAWRNWFELATAGTWCNSQILMLCSYLGWKVPLLLFAKKVFKISSHEIASWKSKPMLLQLSFTEKGKSCNHHIDTDLSWFLEYYWRCLFKEECLVIFNFTVDLVSWLNEKGKQVELLFSVGM